MTMPTYTITLSAQEDASLRAACARTGETPEQALHRIMTRLGQLVRNYEADPDFRAGADLVQGFLNRAERRRRARRN